MIYSIQYSHSELLALIFSPTLLSACFTLITLILSIHNDLLSLLWSYCFTPIHLFFSNCLQFTPFLSYTFNPFIYICSTLINLSRLLLILLSIYHFTLLFMIFTYNSAWIILDWLVLFHGDNWCD